MSLIEDLLDLESPVLQAETPTLGAPLSAFPYPGWRDSGQSAQVRLRSITLENQHIRATICPDLGCRLIGLVLRSSGHLGLPRLHRLTILPDGCWSPSGVYPYVGRPEIPSALGPVNLQLVESEEHGDGIIWQELRPDVSIHASWTLGPDDHAVRLAVRIANRTFEPIPLPTGLVIGAPGPHTLFDADFWCPGLSIWTGDHGYNQMVSADSHAVVSVAERTLAPRSVLGWECAVAPIPLEAPVCASGGTALMVGGDQLSLYTASGLEDGRCEITASDGQRFGAPVNLEPGAGFQAPLAGGLANPSEIRLLTASGETVAAWPVDPPKLAPDVFQDSNGLGIEGKIASEFDERALHRAASFGPSRAAALSALSLVGLARNDLGFAAQSAAESHRLNPEDELTIWLTSTIARIAGTESEALGSAHEIAPLEPCLRAGAFLSLPQDLPREPHALVAPLASDPLALADVACQLIRAERWVDAHRWLDEALRHTDHALLRLLLAWILHRNSRMQAEAASQIAAAIPNLFSPPFPGTPLQRRIVRELAAAYPQIQPLTDFAAWVDLHD